MRPEQVALEAHLRRLSDRDGDLKQKLEEYPEIPTLR
jgi:hypothetical protein